MMSRGTIFAGPDIGSMMAPKATEFMVAMVEVIASRHRTEGGERKESEGE